jgi:hypothetical protein
MSSRPGPARPRARPRLQARKRGATLARHSLGEGETPQFLRPGNKEKNSKEGPAQSRQTQARTEINKLSAQKTRPAGPRQEPSIFS